MINAASVMAVTRNRLDFNAERITLQQLLDWSKRFQAFLKKGTINKTMEETEREKMEETEHESAGSSQDSEENQMQKLPSKFIEFKRKYFVSKERNQYLSELRWLFEDIRSVQDLCRRVKPFWKGTLIESLESFLSSTDRVQGNHELKCPEFGQLKYSMQINEEKALKLFRIIRFKEKQRKLTWKQIYEYLHFVLRMKYRVESVILNAKQAEDTAVSDDGMKILLKISEEDRSRWLFQKTLSLNKSKVTWRQIREYLVKTETVRERVRDIFGDKALVQNYDDNKAAIISDISKDVNQGKDQVLELLKELKAQNEELKATTQSLKEEIDSLRIRKDGNRTPKALDIKMGTIHE